LTNTARHARDRTFYRVVRQNPPALDDFTSNAAKGRPLRYPSPETARLWSGISVNATEAQARRRVRQYPMLGTHIARLAIRADSHIQIERTTRIPGHYTLWGDPAELLSCVTEVVPV
jgi:hypothetical protein